MHRIGLYLKDFSYLATSILGIFYYYFGDTIGFVYGIFIAYMFNVIAGLRANNVRIKFGKICNFKISKFKYSLIEFFIILCVVHLGKTLMIQFEEKEYSVIFVKVLLGIFTIWYFFKTIDNLSKAFPKSEMLNFLPSVIRKMFRKKVPDEFVEDFDKITNNSEDNKEENKIHDNENNRTF